MSLGFVPILGLFWLFFPRNTENRRKGDILSGSSPLWVPYIDSAFRSLVFFSYFFIQHLANIQTFVTFWQKLACSNVNTFHIAQKFTYYVIGSFSSKEAQMSNNTGQQPK